MANKKTLKTREPCNDILVELAKAVETGRTHEVIALLSTGLSSGITAEELLHDGIIRGMLDVGVRFKNHEVVVPEVLIAARALKKGTEILRPALIDEGVKPIGSAVVATVAGDLHDIGKNLVCMMLEGVGFKVYDLGVDVSNETILEAIVKYEPDVLALSALLNTTLNQMRAAIQYVNDNGVRDKVKILVGGAPLDEAFAKKIGADAYANDAVSAAYAAKELLVRE